ncbi:CRISPR system precrRNA processing endoribonuclease RAMP protein Cas6 [Ferrovum myxofaciens]|nr:CRISPR system precrRNA processing endoribonuclease RAMP protein Cas6 [Ferrovum myxofaciens]
MNLPEYAGSALRGAFGHALRGLACVTRSKTCQGCMLAASCTYTAIFEPQKPEGKTFAISTPPVPYIIEPPQWGERRYETGNSFEFHFTLIGHSTRHMGIIILAWQRALMRGIGAGDGTASLEAIHHCVPEGEIMIWNGGAIRGHDHSISLLDEPMASPLSLEFLTPLRLQENGHALPPSRIAARPLLMALVRRASLLAEYYANGPLFTSEEFTRLAEVAQKIDVKKDLRWRDWTRHSLRQKRTMQLGGAIGYITLHGDVFPFRDALRLGEWLHVGKEASFGLGQYRIIQA